MGTSYSKGKEYLSAKYPAVPPAGPTSAAPTGPPPTGAFAAFQSPTLRFRAIADQYSSVEQVQEALRKNGLESSNLIVAVDFTKSNEWTGKRSFGGRSLHAIGEVPSPYEDAISAIGRTLSAFDDDGLIPCYGFGDATTGDKAVFSFLPSDQPCHGLEQVLWRYKELCPYVRMAGPTSFAPAVRQACRIVEQSGNQYHILLLVADGQVSRSSDLDPGQHSEQEQDTINAIVEASNLPLSIVMVGVGDGPWDLMKDFDDALPERKFDNFQFVNFTEVIAATQQDTARREALFALRALMEVPEQYRAIQGLKLMSRNPASGAQARFARVKPPLDPPVPPNVMGGRRSDTGVQAALPPRPSPNHGSSAAPAYQSGGVPSAYPRVGAPPAPVPYYSSGKGEAVAELPACTGGSLPKRVSGSGSAAATGQPSRVSGGGSSSMAGLADEGTARPDPMFICPITQDVMSDPVMATDGYTYERSAISKWLENKTVSPMTNQPMPGGAVLIPNNNLRSAIMEWKQQHGLA